MIAGIEIPDSGEIWVDGRMVCDGASTTAPENRSIGLMFQDFALFPHLTVEQNVVFGLTGPVAAQRKRAGDLLDRVGLRRHLKSYPHALSGGEQQMVAICRGLMSEPRILLLDEPSLGLSPLLVEQMFNLIKQINEGGLSVILVEQNVIQSLSIADRAYVISEGTVSLSGRADELHENSDLKKSYLGL